MKIIAVIPARYASSRFPGKPLADICGKPMIWWVYQQVKKVNGLDEIYVAGDDERIQKICDGFNIPTVMTSSQHPEHISRIHEVSEKIQADLYLCVNGDEPLIDPISIQQIVPSEPKQGIYFGGAARVLTDPAETVDSSNIKIVFNNEGRALYLSRSVIPNPKGTLLFSYYKYVGIECFNKAALDFFVHTQQGNLEKAEDIDHLRFLENGQKLYFTIVDSESLSVDTPKDLEKVTALIKNIESKH